MRTSFASLWTKHPPIKIARRNLFGSGPAMKHVLYMMAGGLLFSLLGFLLGALATNLYSTHAARSDDDINLSVGAFLVIWPLIIGWRISGSSGLSEARISSGCTALTAGEPLNGGAAGSSALHSWRSRATPAAPGPHALANDAIARTKSCGATSGAIRRCRAVSPQTCCTFAECDQCASCEYQRVPDPDPGA
jgi:hypothetical protein